MLTVTQIRYHCIMWKYTYIRAGITNDVKEDHYWPVQQYSVYHSSDHSHCLLEDILYGYACLTIDQVIMYLSVSSYRCHIKMYQRRGMSLINWLKAGNMFMIIILKYTDGTRLLRTVDLYTSFVLVQRFMWGHFFLICI